MVGRNCPLDNGWAPHDADGSRGDRGRDPRVRQDGRCCRMVTRRQARLTRIAAKAAQRSAAVSERALVELERPWLFLESAEVTRRAPPDVPNAWYVSLKWKNVGRTPAIDIQCTFKIEDENTLPKLPDYNNLSPCLV